MEASPLARVAGVPPTRGGRAVIRGMGRARARATTATTAGTGRGAVTTAGMITVATRTTVVAKGRRGMVARRVEARAIPAGTGKTARGTRAERVARTPTRASPRARANRTRAAVVTVLERTAAETAMAGSWWASWLLRWIPTSRKSMVMLSTWRPQTPSSKSRMPPRMRMCAPDMTRPSRSLMTSPVTLWIARVRMPGPSTIGTPCGRSTRTPSVRTHSSSGGASAAGAAGSATAVGARSSLATRSA
mmetsp:Transcript_9770/g.20864  ORF Transcript_9770/g.20864 Transcript_9770/m.20864 type:complete len:247 (+) Transcript_9770:390-1130(+)